MKKAFVGMLILAGCAGGGTPVVNDTPPPPAPVAVASMTTASAAAAPAPAVATITGLEFKKPSASGDGNMVEGCVFASEDSKEAACVSHRLDMGVITSTWSFLDLEQSAVSGAHVVYDGHDDGTGSKPEGIEAVNARLRARGYRSVKLAVPADGAELLEGKGPQRTLKWGGKSQQVTLQPVNKRPSTEEGEQALACCEWQPRSMSEVGGHVAVLLGMECAYTGAPDKKADACYIADYNDESHPHISIVVSFKLE